MRSYEGWRFIKGIRLGVIVVIVRAEGGGWLAGRQDIGRGVHEGG